MLHVFIQQIVLYILVPHDCGCNLFKNVLASIFPRKCTVNVVNSPPQDAHPASKFVSEGWGGGGGGGGRSFPFVHYPATDLAVLQTAVLRAVLSVRVFRVYNSTLCFCYNIMHRWYGLPLLLRPHHSLSVTYVVVYYWHTFTLKQTNNFHCGLRSSTNTGYAIALV